MYVRGYAIFSACSRQDTDRSLRNLLATRPLAAKIATKIVAPHSPTQIDQLNLVFISVEPGLRGPLGVSAIGSRDSHGEATAIGSLDHTVERNHEVTSPQGHGRARSRAIHEAAGDLDAPAGPAVEGAPSRCVYSYPGVVNNSRTARSRSARPAATAGTRAIGCTFHPILAKANHTVVGRGPPASRASNAV